MALICVSQITVILCYCLVRGLGMDMLTILISSTGEEVCWKSSWQDLLPILKVHKMETFSLGCWIFYVKAVRLGAVAALHHQNGGQRTKPTRQGRQSREMGKTWSRTIQLKLWNNQPLNHLTPRLDVVSGATHFSYFLCHLELSFCYLQVKHLIISSFLLSSTMPGKRLYLRQ